MGQSMIQLEDTIDKLDKDFHLIFSPRARLILFSMDNLSSLPFRNSNGLIENEYILTD